MSRVYRRGWCCFGGVVLGLVWGLLEGGVVAWGGSCQERIMMVGSCQERIIMVGSCQERIRMVGSCQERIIMVGSCQERIRMVGSCQEPVRSLPGACQDDQDDQENQDPVRTARSPPGGFQEASRILAPQQNPDVQKGITKVMYRRHN